jgi:acid phosphatase type 7
VDGNYGDTLADFSVNLVILLILVTIISLPVLGDNNTTSTGHIDGPDHITLTWSDDPMTTQTITWRTEPVVNSCVVQYSVNQDLRSPETTTAK